MRKLILAFTFIAVNIVFAQEAIKADASKKVDAAKTEIPKKEIGIPFLKSDWKEAVAKATKEKKYLFIDAYTVWCNPCKWMDTNVYNSKKAEDYFGEKFISIKMDMEKDEGLFLKDKYKVEAYPTYLFFDPTGKKSTNWFG